MVEKIAHLVVTRFPLQILSTTLINKPYFNEKPPMKTPNGNLKESIRLHYKNKPYKA